MANANTIAVAPGLPSAAMGASSTAEFQFTDTASTPVRLMVKVGQPQLKNKLFKVKAGGRVTGGTTTNFTVKLDSGTSATIGSNTTIEASSARAVDSESANWFIEAVCFCDETSDKLGGFGRSMVNDLYDAEAALDAEAAADPDGELGFTVTGTFSASHASNAAYCDFFDVEVL